MLDLVNQVHDTVLMNVYLEVRNPGGSGFWNWGYMSKESVRYAARTDRNGHKHSDSARFDAVFIEL